MFRDRYERLFKSATSIFREFKAETHVHATAVDEDVFIQRLTEAAQERDLPDQNDEQAVTEFVLPKIIAENSDLGTMRIITEWIASKFEETINSSPDQPT